MSSIDAKLTLIIYTDRQNHDSVVYMAVKERDDSSYPPWCPALALAWAIGPSAVPLGLELAIRPSPVDLKRASGGNKTKLGRQLRKCIKIGMHKIRYTWFILLVACTTFLPLIRLTLLPVPLLSLTIICHRGRTDSIPFSSMRLWSRASSTISGPDTHA